MLTLSEIKKRLEVNLQEYPDIYARYLAGVPTVCAHLNALASFLADQAVDLEKAQLEPFIKSNERTILADAVNKGILPIATPCQHKLRIENKGNNPCSLSAGRLLSDAEGRIWRLIQTANIPDNTSTIVVVEQSTLRHLNYNARIKETFHTVELDLQEDSHLAGLTVSDDSGNVYTYCKRWMNVEAGKYAYTLKMDSRKRIGVEFGDSERVGQTLQPNTLLTFSILETDGEVDVNHLLEASLEEIIQADEAKLELEFVSNGLIRSGANPLNTEQLRLLSSYPTYDDNAVLLSDFDHAVRKKFMNRCHYLTIWNESVHSTYYPKDITNDDINKLKVAFKPKAKADKDQLIYDLKRYIKSLDSLYDESNVDIIDVEQRAFRVVISAKLAPVHNTDAVKEEIRNLLLSKYGQNLTATSYFLPDGFNTQDISKLLTSHISAFQDKISDFKIQVEDIAENPIKPHQCVFMTKDSISIEISRTALSGASLWTD